MYFIDVSLVLGDQYSLRRQSCKRPCSSLYIVVGEKSKRYQFYFHDNCGICRPVLIAVSLLNSGTQAIRKKLALNLPPVLQAVKFVAALALKLTVQVQPRWCKTVLLWPWNAKRFTVCLRVCLFVGLFVCGSVTVICVSKIFALNFFLCQRNGLITRLCKSKDLKKFINSTIYQLINQSI